MNLKKENIFWHNLSCEQALLNLESSKELGLKNAEATKRLSEYGENKLKEVSGSSALEIFFSQFQNILVIILILAAVLSASLGHFVESFAVASIVVFSAVLGFFQEYKAEKSMQALQSLAIPKCLVIRDGKSMEVLSSELVVGDILLLSAGNKVSADGRLLSAFNLLSDESPLTGESLPSEKQSEIVLLEDTPLGDRKNMVYAGTTISYGRGVALVTATGMNTELGKIAQLLSGVKQEDTPLKKNLHELGKKLGFVALLVVLLIISLGFLRGESLVEMLLFGVSLAVAVVPEALPAVVTVSLALGASRMVKKNALVRSMPIVETLGTTSVICTDKTGTLTKDEMTLKSVVTKSGEFTFSGSGYEPKGKISFANKEVKQLPVELSEILTAGVLCSDANLVFSQNQWQILGDATEGALLVGGHKAGIFKETLQQVFSRTEEIPFSSENKYMVTLHIHHDTHVLHIKGAIEKVVSMCDRIFTETGLEKFSEQEKEKFLNLAEEYSKKGQRVLALAKSTSTKNLNSPLAKLEFLGLVSMADSLREEARQSVALCKTAGIRVIMITGDHPATASAIASEVGILEKNQKAVVGTELDTFNSEEFSHCIASTNAFARVSPEHKLKIVKELQKQGQIVAMTGDGVNDAPALKMANVGVAMGIKGTDVSKEAAGMTLLDDNFASIVSAVNEGRIIFENIKKYLIYLLSAHVGEVVLISTAVILGWPLPLTAVQILFVNLACDGPPALALAGEKGDLENMKRSPRDPKVGVFTKRTVSLILVAAVWTTILNFLIFYGFWKQSGNLELAVTATFISLVCIQLFKAYSLKSDHLPFYKNIWNNKWLNFAVFGQIPVLWAVSHLSWAQKIFSTTALNLQSWITIICISATIILVVELSKKILNKLEIN